MPLLNGVNPVHFAISEFVSLYRLPVTSAIVVKNHPKMTYRRSLLFCRDPGNELQRMMDPVCLADVEDFAKKHLPKHAFDYFAGGANEESTLEENVKAFKR